MWTRTPILIGITQSCVTPSVSSNKLYKTPVPKYKNITTISKMLTSLSSSNFSNSFVNTQIKIPAGTNKNNFNAVSPYKNGKVIIYAPNKNEKIKVQMLPSKFVTTYSLLNLSKTPVKT